MAWHGRGWSMGLVVLLAGCVSEPEWALPKKSLSEDISQPPKANIVRCQVKDIEKPTTFLPQPQLPKATLNQVVEPAQVVAPPPGLGTEQVSFANRGRVRVRGRAWVNGRPIFENEV